MASTSQTTMSIFPSPGPSMPQFKSLLVKGTYHASAPVHLCLSRVSSEPEAKVVLVVPSRSALRTALKRLNDEWIQSHGGEGQVSALASKVDVLYPPTPAHLIFLLSMFHEALVGQPDFLHSKTTFATTPSLIVLCDLSSYFKDHPEAIVSSYVMLVSHALATVSTLSERSGECTSLAVFDRELDALKLPLMRPADEEQGSSSSVRRESLGYIVQRYFEWVGTAEETMDESMLTNVKRRCKLNLKRPIDSDSDGIILSWTERTSDDGSISFTFPI